MCTVFCRRKGSLFLKNAGRRLTRAISAIQNYPGGGSISSPPPAAKSTNYYGPDMTSNNPHTTEGMGGNLGGPGLVFGKFSPPTKAHLYLINFPRLSCRKLTI